MPNLLKHFAAIVAICVSTGACAQLLNGALDKVDSTVKSTLPQQLPETGALTDRPLGKTAATAQSVAGKLPDSLPIRTVKGGTAFVEVATEIGFRAVQREWLLSISARQRAVLNTRGIDIVEEQDYPALELKTLRIRVPEKWDHAERLRRRLQLDDSAILDRNHIYSPQAASPQPPATTTISHPPACDSAVSLGMVDTAINSKHPALADARVVARSFQSPDLPTASAHGTAVAALLVGRGPNLSPLVPNATLYAADIFYDRDAYSQGATLDTLLRALQWLAEQRVPVINMSLAGPPNALLAQAVQTLAARQIHIVAAVGNEGPASPPLYPAAYADTLGVTAVDDTRAIYRWANRGVHVDFAALGVRVLTARGEDGFGVESGTSLAAPLVSARLACAMAAFGGDDVVEKLIGEAQDLGEPGKDPVYGHGLLTR